jgi:serine/threonine protein kinase/Tol biopolymer transport system component
MLASGTRIGSYEILAPIGAGGGGEVFRARDTKLGREVAIKILSAEFAKDHQRVARFEREAQILASLNHPNIAAIHGLEEVSGQTFLILELVEGDDLSQRLEKGPLRMDEAIAIARQIAEALEAAHEKGIVHRDLKPANIKITPEGKVKLLDFGLGKAVGQDASKIEEQDALTLTRAGHVTEDGAIMGTPAYMAPEQARGASVGRHADIWSFGVVVFEMLTGKRLFEGKSIPDILVAVLTRDPDWTALPSKTPASLVPLLRRCLERDATSRLQSIGEARIILQRCLDDDGRANGAKRRALLAIGAMVALIAIAAAVTTAFKIGRRESQVDSSELKITPLTNTGNVISVAISPDGRFIAYVEADQGQASLWLKQLAGGQVLQLIPNRAVSYWGHTFSPDGSSIVFGEKSPQDPKGGLFSISTLGGTPRRLLSDLDSQVTFSPDGKRLAYTRLSHPTPQETALMIASADGSNPTVLAAFKPPDQVAGIYFGAPSWSPDGRTIVTAVGQTGSRESDSRARPDTRGRLVSVSVATGSVTTLTDPGWITPGAVGFLPDGKSLLATARAADQAQTQIWSVSYPGGEARRVTADLNDHRVISLTADGKTLVSISGSTATSVWTLPLRGPGRLTRISRSTADGLNGLVFTPEGRLVYTTHVGNMWSLWTSGVDGADRKLFLAGREGETLSAPFVTDDGAVYYISRVGSASEVRVAQKDGSSSRVVIRDAPFDAFGVSPDGKTIVYSQLVEGATHLFAVDENGAGKRQISDTSSSLAALELLGNRVVFYFHDLQGRFRLGVRSIEGGSLLKDLAAGPRWAYSRLALTSDGIYLNSMTGDRVNVWLLPLNGSPARKVTSFEDQQIYDFAVSRDGSTLAVARGPRIRDAQMITGFAGAGAKSR